MVNPRISLVDEPLQILILLNILLDGLFLFGQFYIDYVEKDFGAADLICLTFNDLPELVVLHLDESAVDAAHVLDVEVSGLPQVRYNNHPQLFWQIRRIRVILQMPVGEDLEEFKKGSRNKSLIGMLMMYRFLTRELLLVNQTAFVAVALFAG